MQRYRVKLVHIIPTYVAVTVATMGSILLLRWIFSILLPLLNWNVEVWEFWIPILLPWIPFFIWIHPRLQILKTSPKGNIGYSGIYILSILLFIVTFFVAQQWVSGATSQKITVQSIDNLKPHRNVGAIKITGDFRLDGSSARSYTDARPDDRHNKNLDIAVYFAVPFMHQSDGANRYWLGLRFTKQISNDAETAQKEKLYKAFYDSAVTAFKSYDFSGIHYFRVLSPSKEQTHFRNAIQSRQPIPNISQTVILVPRADSFQKRSSPSLARVIGIFAAGLLLMALGMIFSSFNRTLYIQQKKRLQPTRLNLQPYLRYLVPREPRWVSTILVEVNVLVFIAMIFNGVDVLFPSGSELLTWGANRRAEVLHGQWWRLGTSIFVHGGISHLVFNMFGLVLAAFFIEPKFKRIYFAALYLCAGIGASLASIYWHARLISVGASGAIMGLCGATLALALTAAFDKKIRSGLLGLIGAYVLVNLLWGLAGGVDNAAHIGGLFSGALFGWLFYTSQQKWSGSY